MVLISVGNSTHAAHVWRENGVLWNWIFSLIRKLPELSAFFLLYLQIIENVVMSPKKLNHKTLALWTFYSLSLTEKKTVYNSSFLGFLLFTIKKIQICKMFELFSVISKEKTKKNIIYMVETNIVHPCDQIHQIFNI